MPTYLYKNTDTGEIYELRQSMRDDAYTAHPESGVPVKRVLARPGIAFKGSGFYANDSRPREKSGDGGGEGKSAPKAESKGSPSSKGGGEG
ncbi:hypothetical protein GCM10010840_33230 [Deinococcus aerolatus]|uniref:Regulatory protein, FmdB family n=1 Tax=Deinococcus aerolatus TaxID=522487 RepID=A0ABQ2GG09_9DEIO|nr:FmdB family zinc ribbon protein [Deinococcus aerolatus]GGL92430.1 hypothetical protein GCM10010840_33230 [Deinococcus aerolatus]